MKFKKIYKFLNCAFLPTIATSPFFALSYQNKVMDNNVLRISTSNEQFFDSLKINSYDYYSNNYVIYATESNLSILTKKVFVYIFRNNFDFYYDGVSALKEKLKDYESKKWVEIYNAFETKDNIELMSFTYVLNFKTMLFAHIKDWNYVNSITFNKTEKQNTFYPSFTLNVMYGHRWKIVPNGDPNVTKPIHTETVPYNDKMVYDYTKIFTLWGFHKIKFEFKNINFVILDESITSNYEIKKSIFNLRIEDIENLFNNKTAEFEAIGYDLEKITNYDVKINIKSVSYKIKTNWQDLTFHYLGSYSLYFTNANFELNPQIVLSQTRLNDLTNEKFLEKILMDYEYKKLISSIEIEKDYFNNIANLKIKFDKKKVDQLLFKNFFIKEFSERELILDYGNDLKIEIDTTKIENNSFKNFNPNDLIFYTRNPNCKISLLSVEFEKNVEQKIVNAKYKIKKECPNFSKEIWYTKSFDNFLTYDLSKLNSFLKSKILEFKNFDLNEFNIFLENKDNWIQLVDSNREINIEILQTAIIDEKLLVKIGIYNNENILIDKKDFFYEIRKINSELDEIKSNQKFNYWYLLILLIIPLIFLLIKLVRYKKKRNKI